MNTSIRISTIINCLTLCNVRGIIIASKKRKIYQNLALPFEVFLHNMGHNWSTGYFCVPIK